MWGNVGGSGGTHIFPPLSAATIKARPQELALPPSRTHRFVFEHSDCEKGRGDDSASC